MSEETTQQQCEKCIDKLMLGLIKKSNEISRGMHLPKAQWITFYRLQMMLHYYPNPQPLTLCNL
jgi:predicted DNA-binding protein (MmcQ/YjbR family)